MNIIKLTVLISTLLSFNAYSQPIYNSFKTPIERAQWIFSGNSFNCSIEHNVENFGQFKMSAMPGDELLISLHSQWLVLDDHVSSIAITASPWQAPHTINPTSSALTWQGNKALMSRHASQFIEALALGSTWQAQIDTQDQQHYLVKTAPINTRGAVEQFRQCQKQLVPKPFSYVRQREFYFDSNSSVLNSQYDDDLMAIAKYVAADAAINTLLIDGYTDNTGDYYANLQLSKTRAYEVQSKLVELGVPVSKIEVRHHGARKPIANNQLANGRELNRRVVMRLVKSTHSNDSQTTQVDR